MAFYKEKHQRDFRIHTDSNTSIDFSQIKVGKETLKGEIATLINYHKRNYTEIKQWVNSAWKHAK